MAGNFHYGTFHKVVSLDEFTHFISCGGGASHCSRPSGGNCEANRKSISRIYWIMGALKIICYCSKLFGNMRSWDSKERCY